MNEITSSVFCNILMALFTLSDLVEVICLFVTIKSALGSLKLGGFRIDLNVAQKISMAIKC